MENVNSLEWLKEEPLASLNKIKLEKLARGERIIDLSMVNPDFEPPSLALDKLTEATLKSGQHRYAVSRGIRKLREAFSRKYSTAFHVELDPDRELCVSLGTKDAISLALACVCQKKRHVLVGAPCYPMYRSAALLMGISLEFFPISSSEDLMLDEIEKCLALNPRIGMLLLNFPNNPTGQSVSLNFYKRLSEIVEKYSCFVLNDFVYGEMAYSSKCAVSLLSEDFLRKRSLETYSLSKAYSVPGWRIASISGNPEMINLISKLKSHVDYGAFLPIQAASAALLNCEKDLVEAVREKYLARFRLMKEGLNRMGWRVQSAQGGACLWARLPEDQRAFGSIPFSENLLNQCGIVVMPGVLFGSEFDEFVRFALVVAEEKLQEALLRLEGFAYNAFKQ
ncbi:MAG: aminotransferase class I/II-fold pyridoxal phosphate-dependent enzyme [SAR324 cluster bacterium]|uniref:Aminotransferase n=1 Tax=SAR324 cluster bacterium TaxID=2024889 RepID=A0A7X9FPK1_9DELT|nr:aminotransferase class I/II-fold pyridoxal phosphate-dependent enzyme [SAR324 cluster bacterium]